ncbi:RNase adapter RapZ [Streptomyces bacillaris]|uniref:RapZ C-terminal domain-containing protein n=1 Tax=Streptomyces bacillaris TaxID=68179 RepID=UPI00345FD2E6
MTTIRILSFAYGRAAAPTADLTIDLRALLRIPAADPELRQLTGLDQPVYDHVMNTPGAEWLAVHAVATARGLARETGADVTIAWGCTSGQHRSISLARASYDLLHAAGDRATITHLDIHDPPAPRTDPSPEDGGDLLLVDLDGGRGGPLPDNPR